MTRRVRLAVTMSAAVALLGIPAYAATDGDPISSLKRQVAALKAKVRTLETRERKQSADNRLLREQVDRAATHIRLLRRFVLEHGDCAVTAANGNRPPGSVPGDTFHGNGTLWVGLWSDGVYVAHANMIRADGTVGIKFGWWRGVEGPLRIDGHRIDASAPPVGASIPDGYAATGFQATSVLFPTQGCWEVVGRLADSSLSFTVLVLKP